MDLDSRRLHALNTAPDRPGPVVYWMSRDQRVTANWALLHARNLAAARRQPLHVVFSLADAFLGATIRHFRFMLRGLAGVSSRLGELNIPFHLLRGNPAEQLPEFVARVGAGILVTDFDPLRLKREWQAQVAARVGVPLIEVDAHNIVPCRTASPKQEFGAYTLRPKLHKRLGEFLVPIPALQRLPPAPVAHRPDPVDWEATLRGLQVDRSVGEVAGFAPGEAAALKTLRTFIAKRLPRYAAESNDPNAAAISDLSPYLHFGQLSAQQAALEIMDAPAPPEAKAAFLEQLVVRRELSDNYCLYQPAYDRSEGFPAWARATLDAHRGDRRDHLYTPDLFESARTHDPLWNAAQLEMVRGGKMHNYMRMYWAKKILEWTRSPEEAQEIAIRLNDRYELDGRDPNGYTGIAWSIGGVHDRAWGERDVFGKIRYMSAGGCRSKFDVKAYIRRVEELG